MEQELSWNLQGHHPEVSAEQWIQPNPHKAIWLRSPCSPSTVGAPPAPSWYLLSSDMQRAASCQPCVLSWWPSLLAGVVRAEVPRSQTWGTSPTNSPDWVDEDWGSSFLRWDDSQTQPQPCLLVSPQDWALGALAAHRWPYLLLPPRLAFSLSWHCPLFPWFFLESPSK